jgi:uncharacterized protein YeaO (DUF488 family)
MKEWNFTFSDDNDWGWNSVYARGLKSATNKADKWVKKNFPSNKLDEGSVNCNPSTYDMLMRSFY